ncbi:hypothetical protein NPIL_242011 [Nephila pilipes]|uniref:Uncharacterized protein n=1 Tax=Nephila pilipes TaxID=299642 RepID=A0A8X6U379_NEPPI|nr:hypothetical protein NPIL_242011 [Nephila pilipes]
MNRFDDKVSMKIKQKISRRSENIPAAKTITDEEPSTTTWHLTQQLVASPVTVWRIARTNVEHFPYRENLVRTSSLPKWCWEKKTGFRQQYKINM